jgi:hypothetical protein
MFDLKFYLMISYFFEYEYNIFKHYRQKVLSRRGHQNKKISDEALLLTMNKIEQLDNYKSTGFLSYLSDYENYF